MKEKGTLFVARIEGEYICTQRGKDNPCIPTMERANKLNRVGYQLID
jgi:hypothetical protein